MPVFPLMNEEDYVASYRGFEVHVHINTTSLVTWFGLDALRKDRQRAVCYLSLLIFFFFITSLTCCKESLLWQYFHGKFDIS